MLIGIVIACIVVVLIVSLLSITTTSKAYSYKHKVDPLPDERKKGNTF